MSRSLLEKELKPYAGNLFIETGTYQGGGVVIALRSGFKRVISIEANDELFLFSSDKFKDDDRVEIFKGNSPDILWTILPELDEPAVIFLDAHASNYNPIFDELNVIKEQDIKTHTIMIDDLGEYGPTRFWKDTTVQDLIDAVMEINPEYSISYMRSFNKIGDILVAEV